MRSQRAATFSATVNGKIEPSDRLAVTMRTSACRAVLSRRSLGVDGSLGEGGTSDISLLPPTDMPVLIVLSEAPLGLPVSHWL